MHGHMVKGNVLHCPDPPLGLVVVLSVMLSSSARQMAQPFWLSLVRTFVLTLFMFCMGVSSGDERLTLSLLRAFVLIPVGVSSWDKRLNLVINHFGLMLQLGPGKCAGLLT